MDEFGVLVESIGFKAQGKSAPMAKLKSQPKQPSYSNGFPSNIARPTSSNNISNDPFFVDDLDGIFRSNSSGKINNNSADVLGGPFSSRKSSGAGGGIGLDDLFVGNSNTKDSVSLNDDFLFGSMAKNDDVFGLNSNNSTRNFGKNGSGSDDLIPGFGQTNNGARSTTGSAPQSNTPSNLFFPPAEDPLSVFESFSTSRDASLAANTSSSIDELEDFAMGGSRSSANDPSDVTISKEAINKVQEKLRNIKDFGDKRNSSPNENIKVSFPKKDVEKSRVAPDTLNHKQAEKDKGTEQRVRSKEKNPSRNEDDLGEFFTSDGQTTDVRRPGSTNEDPLLDALFRGRGETKVEKNSQKSHCTKKATSSSIFVDDFSALFGEPASSAVEFQEIDGEPDERRRARFNHIMKTKERMANALKEKNERDLQVQREQEEKRRLAETLDADVKRWAAGKEGNLRALLSSLQYVLWSECGWQPVSLTDLITSTSVKKAYLKATLYVHPDKVQQKGAKEKYIAERVFDLLKEAWNKFNAEELR